MQTEFDKLAQQIFFARAPIFQHRNKTNVNPIPAKKIEELQRQFHGHIEDVKLRKGWADASRRKITNMNMTDYMVLYTPLIKTQMLLD